MQRSNLKSKLSKVIYFEIVENIWPAVYFFGQLLISTFSMYLALIFTNLMIPVTGRMGASINTELLITVVSFLLCILVYGLIVSFTLLEAFSKPKWQSFSNFLPLKILRK